ncbi:MAG: aryl-sulfate sulfotransferase [Chthoniobacterales bacterium]
MKNHRSFLVAYLLFVTCHLALGTQADDTTITVTGQNPGATPLIKQLVLLASDTSVIRSIEFTIAPKPGSVTRPLSSTSAVSYLIDRGYLNPATGEIFLPVWGLYAGYANSVTLTYRFLDGSSKQDSITITTDPFVEACGYNAPIVLQARTDTTALSYDYLMVKGYCSYYSPGIIDTDGELRWVGAGGLSGSAAAFFDNAMYLAVNTILYRIDLDGTVSLLHDYSDIGVVDFHHNVDRGKFGLFLEADTAAQVESTILEVDATGTLLKRWDMSEIISQAMLAGGDDPTQFVFPSPDDWFHNNATSYNGADDTIIISSRQSFVIAIDYQSDEIKWILGDPSKQWYVFPSLTQFAFTLTPNSLPPIGQHAVSVAYDEDLLLFDNGYNSTFYDIRGDLRTYSAPRRYCLDEGTVAATEVWNYEMDQSVDSPVCGSVYEDSPNNYLVDYAFENGFGAESNYARVLGLSATGEKVFDYRYPTVSCSEIFNAVPLHLESTSLPRVGPQALNLSTRALVGTGDQSLIAGFIVTGDTSKTLVLRALGPSLSNSGVTGALPDPTLTVFDSSGALIASNDNWETDPAAAAIAGEQLAPDNSLESATMITLAPGTYTAVVSGQNGSTGIGLVEAYDLSPTSGSILANLSARGFVGTGDNVLIGGFIIGDVASSTVVVRALGPSLPAQEVSQPLADPMLTIYDTNGSEIASNDNWQDGKGAGNIQLNGLAPLHSSESALLLNLPAGLYSAVVRGANATTGVALVEIYDLH